MPRYRHTIEVPGYDLPGHLARTRCGRVVAYGRMPNVPRTDLRFCPRCRALEEPAGAASAAAVREETGSALLLQQLTIAQVRLLADLRSRSDRAGADGERPAIGSPQQVFDLLAPELEPLLQEQLRALLLDTRHRMMDLVTLYQGTVAHVTVRMAEIFRDAIVVGAPAIVLAHNPSGDPEPSPDDLALTREAAQAGELLGVELLDHVIIGRGNFVSLKQRGVL